MTDPFGEHPWDPWFLPSPAVPTPEPLMPPVAPPVDASAGLPAWDAALFTPITESWPLLPGNGAQVPGPLDEAGPVHPRGLSVPVADEAWFSGMRALNASHPGLPPVFEIDPTTGHPYRAPSSHPVTPARGGMPRAPRGFVRTCNRCGKELEGGGKCPACHIEFCDQCGEIKEHNDEGEMECPRCFGRGLHPWLQLSEWEQEG
ncbi:MAG: hypothetical protein HY700_16835 [Gemmatimonadetes bacterium]|nr:hypothetical protein [Gemmatimonadota bacterium]